MIKRQVFQRQSALEVLLRSARGLILAAMGVAFIPGAAAYVSAGQVDEANPVPGPDASAASAGNFELELGQLSPDHPDAYFRLGETAMDVGRSDLAERLFVLAAHLDRDELGRSACLALAELARQDGDIERANRLHAMASMLPFAGSKQAESASSMLSPESSFQRTGARIASMFGFYRTGHGSAALRALEGDRDTFEMLARFERGIAFVSEALTYCRNHPHCEECSNELVVKDPEWINQQRERGVNRPFIRPGSDLFILCPRSETHTPNLREDEISRMLELESALVLGKKARWGARTLLGEGAPRPVLEPASLASMFEIDPSRTVYRDGTWVQP